MKRKSYLLFQMLTGLWLLSLALPSAAQEISADNTSRYVGKERWKWTVFIRTSQQVLKDIKCVEYTLHPTFPDPIQTVCSLGNPRHPFGYMGNGWGTFEIPIKVTFKNGKVRSLKHMLTFTTAPSVGVSFPIKVDNDAKEIRKGWWKWTVFIQGPENVLDQVRCVEYTLHRTFPNPVREVCDRGTGPRAFALTTSGWGTFEIRIRVFLKDGRVQELTHVLRF